MVPGAKGRLGKPSLFALSLALVTTTACSAPPAQPQSPAPSPPRSAPTAELAPTSEAIARADALLEDFRRREAAQAKFDRENPPPKFIPIPRSLIAAARTTSASSASDAAPSNTSATSRLAPAAPVGPAAAAPARDEMWWKAQMQTLQAALDAELVKLAEAEKLNLKYGYNDAQAQYKKQAAAVASARQAIERLRDEARRTSVPPGWLRP